MASWAATLIEQCFNGLSLAGIYLLVALGVSLLFGLSRIVFFAQGELVTLGAFLCYSLTQIGVPVALSVLIATVACGLFGEGLDLVVLRRTINRPINGFVASLGLIVALEGAYSLIWPNSTYSITPIFSGITHLGPIVISNERILIIGITALVAVGAFAVLHLTHYGRGIRALSEDRLSARAVGVPVGRMISVVFIASCALAGLAGSLLGTVFPFTSGFGTEFLIIGFGVATVGGLGRVSGCVIAALVLALAQTLGGAYISLTWSYAIFIVAMMIIILVRPNGLLSPRNLANLNDPLSGATLGGDDASIAASAIAAGTAAAQAVVRWSRRCAIPVILVLAAVFPLLESSVGDTTVATFALINCIAVYGIWLCLRQGGVFSVAQAAFVGVGSYASAIVAIHLSAGFWPELLVALVAGMVSAAIIGLISLRTSGAYFAILLFGFGELLVTVLSNGGGLTGGATGLVITNTPDVLGNAVNFGSPTAFYYLCLVIVIIVIGLVRAIARSGFGVRMRGIRDNERLAASLGAYPFWNKLLVFVIAGGLTGISGTLYLYASLGIGPDFFNSNTSIQLILMLMIGGVLSLAGPLVGAIVAGFLPVVLGVSSYSAQVIYGVLLVAMVMLMPRGLAGAGDSVVRFLTGSISLQRRGSPAAAVESQHAAAEK
jgi:branched-chain amino acid transport system permease protein